MSLSISKKGNLSFMHLSHCQLPLKDWKEAEGLLNLLHLVRILLLQQKQGTPGLFLDNFFKQMEHFWDKFIAKRLRLSREYLSEDVFSLSKPFLSTLWKGKTVGLHVVHSQLEEIIFDLGSPTHTL